MCGFLFFFHLIGERSFLILQLAIVFFHAGAFAAAGLVGGFFGVRNIGFFARVFTFRLFCLFGGGIFPGFFLYFFSASGFVFSLF